MNPVALPIAVGIDGRALTGQRESLLGSGILGLGPDVLANGNFATDTVWVKGLGWTIAAGLGTVTLPASPSTLTQAVSILAGQTWLCTYTATGYVGGSVRVRLQNSGAAVSNSPASAGNGTYSVLIVAIGGGNEFAFFAPNSLASLSIDSVSLRLVL